MIPKKNTTLVVLAFLAIYLIWGSTYLLNKIAVQELPPFMLASLRFVTASALIFIIAKILGIGLHITKRQFLNCGIAGFLFLTLGNGGVVWALRFVDSGFTALEISAQPLVVLLLMWILQGKKIRPTSMIGVVLGIIGIYLLVSQKEIVSKEGTLLGVVIIFICMLSWAYSSLFVSKADLPKNFFVNTGYQMLIGGLLLSVVSLILGESWTSPIEWKSETQWSMLILIVFGSVLAFTSFNYLLKVVSPEKVATSTYVNPIVAMILGWYFLDEKVTMQSAIAAVILLSGVYFVNTKKELIKMSGSKKS